MYDVAEAINYFAKYNVPLDKIFTNGKKRGLGVPAIKEAIEWFLSVKPDTLCRCNHRHEGNCEICGCEEFVAQVPRSRITWVIWEKADKFQSAARLRELSDEYKQAHELIREKKILLKQNNDLRFIFILVSLGLIGMTIAKFGG